LSAAPPLTELLERKHHSPWQAKLDLHLARRGGKTVLAHTRHRGPLYIQQPFYPEGDGICHLPHVWRIWTCANEHWSACFKAADPPHFFP